MSKSKKTILLLLIMASSLFFAAYNFVPVISVESKKVNFREFLKIKSALEKALSTSAAKFDGDLNTIAMMNLIEQEFLDILIDNVDRNLKLKAEEIVREAISKTPNLSLDKASEEIYGLSSKDFKRLVLLPQAKRDILDSYFKNKNEDVLQAWASLYGTASIKVYYPGYYWDTKEYTIKKK